MRPEPTSAAAKERAPRRAGPRFGRRSFTLAATLLLAAFSPLAADERVALDRGWRFLPGDDAPYARPGHWNDPDMLVVGWVGWGPALHPSALTPNEQYTDIGLWSLLSAPLLIGCDLARLDPFTLGPLTNDEVLALDRDRLDRPATPRIKAGDIQVWLKDLADGSHAVGVFNLGETAASYTLDLGALGLDRSYTLRDVWRQGDLGVATGSRAVKVPRRGVVLLRLSEFHPSSARETSVPGGAPIVDGTSTPSESGESL